MYIDSTDRFALEEISSELAGCIINRKELYSEILVLCIGTDRATGDSLGPLTGSMLKKTMDKGNQSVYIMGCLDYPVHAANLSKYIAEIKKRFAKPLIIAVDASLGSFANIGRVKISDGAIKPGTALNKNLPDIGNLHITGIVNFKSDMNEVVLQTTKLGLVMHMAELIAGGIKNAFAISDCHAGAMNRMI